MTRKTILILNNEKVLLIAPLAELLSQHANHIHTVYHTPYIPPQTDKYTYITTTLRIFDKSYWLKYAIKLFRNRILGSFLFPATWTKKYKLESLVKSYNIAFVELLDVNDKYFIKQLKEQGIRTALSLTNQLYRAEIINIPGFKIYNIHPSLLPNNKGSWPIFWAIVKGDEHGITCHEVNEQIDAGKIILQTNLGLLTGLNIERVMELIIMEMPKTISSALDLVITQDIKPILSNQPDFYGNTPSKENIQAYFEKLNEV